MPAFSFPALFNSVITFWQQIGEAYDVLAIPLPSSVQNVVTGMLYLFQYIINLIPSFPDFDTRGQMVILSIGVPIIIDLIFVWFMNPIYKTIAHLIDIVASFLAAYSIAVAAFGAMSLFHKIALSVALVYLAAHLVLVVVFRNKQKKHTFQEISQEIRDHFLSGVVPNVKSNRSIEEINSHVHQFSGFIQIVPTLDPIWIPITFVLVGIALLVLALLISGVIDINYSFPPAVVVILPIIFYVFAIIFIIIGFLKFTMFGTNFILAVKKFSKRWALRVIMLFFDILYIPIMSNFTDLLSIEKVTCPVGTYPQIHRTGENMDMFVSHTFSCAVCSQPMNQTIKDCIEICSETTQYYTISKETGLEYVENVLGVAGIGMLYSFFAFIVGIPLLWFYMTKVNVAFARTINVYGKTTEAKWTNLMHKMKTTGIFLFDEYEFKYPMYCVVDLIGKAVLMLITSICIRYVDYLVFLLPVFFLVMSIIGLILKPYIYIVNDYTDILLNFFNMLFTVVPILGYFDIGLNLVAGIIVCCLIVLIPFIIIIVLIIIFRNDSKIDPNDPTIVTALSAKQIEERNNKLKQGLVTSSSYFFIPTKKMNQSSEQLIVNQPTKSNDDQIITKETQNEEEDKGDEKSSEIKLADIERINYNDQKMQDAENNDDEMNQTFYTGFNQSNHFDGKEENIDEEEKIEMEDEIENNENIEDLLNFDAYVYQNLPEDFVTLNEKDLLSIDDFEKIPEEDDEKDLLEQNDDTFQVNKHLLSRRFKAMYQVLDVIVDGHTIDLLNKILTVLVLLGAAVFGWYAGSIIEQFAQPYNTCGVI